MHGSSRSEDLLHILAVLILLALGARLLYHSYHPPIPHHPPGVPPGEPAAGEQAEAVASLEPHPHPAGQPPEPVQKTESIDVSTAKTAPPSLLPACPAAATRDTLLPPPGDLKWSFPAQPGVDPSLQAAG